MCAGSSNIQFIRPAARLRQRHWRPGSVGGFVPVCTIEPDSTRIRLDPPRKNGWPPALPELGVPRVPFRRQPDDYERRNSRNCSGPPGQDHCDCHHHDELITRELGLGLFYQFISWELRMARPPRNSAGRGATGTGWSHPKKSSSPAWCPGLTTRPFGNRPLWTSRPVTGCRSTM